MGTLCNLYTCKRITKLSLLFPTFLSPLLLFNCFVTAGIQDIASHCYCTCMLAMPSTPRTPLIKRLKKSPSFKGGNNATEEDDGNNIKGSTGNSETDRHQHLSRDPPPKHTKRSSSLPEVLLNLSVIHLKNNNSEMDTLGEMKPPPLSPLKRLMKKAPSKTMGKFRDYKITVDTGVAEEASPPTDDLPTTPMSSGSPKKRLSLNNLLAAMKISQAHSDSLVDDDNVFIEATDTVTTSSSTNNPLEQIFLKLAENNLVHTSELEPSKHQIMIPTIHEIVLHAQICLLVENYSTAVIHPSINTNINATFHWQQLCGLSRTDLERACNNMLSLSSRDSKHPYHSILKTLLFSVEDLTVEAYLCVGGLSLEDEEEEDIVEVTIFSSQKYRQFIVCFHVPQSQDARYYQQQKRNPAAEMVVLIQDLNSNNKRKPDTMPLHPKDHPIPIHTYIREGYFSKQDLEQQVFAVVNLHSSKDPFMNVTFTGHGLGGALCKVSSLRFASMYPAMTVSCHVFGTPRIGDITFRLFANSLPNLNVIRIENGCDPYVRLPEDTNSVKWAHIGHTITVGDDYTGSSSTSTATTTTTPHTSQAYAYRFDERRPTKPNLFFWNDPKKVKAMKERDHEISSYVISLQQYHDPSRPWVTNFVGEEGPGISGINDEVRCMV